MTEMVAGPWRSSGRTSGGLFGESPENMADSLSAVKAMVDEGNSLSSSIDFVAKEYGIDSKLLADNYGDHYSDSSVTAGGGRFGMANMGQEVPPQATAPQQQSISDPGSDQRSGLLQALAGASQRPTVEAPVTQAPDPKLRILQALSSIAGPLLGIRDQRATDKRNRAAQATANVVNALSKGRAGARGLQEEAKPGILTQLSQIPGQAAGIGLQVQADKQAAEQAAFENQLKANESGDRFGRLNTLTQRLQEEERLRLASGNLGLRGRTTEVTEGRLGLAERKFAHRIDLDTKDLGREVPSGSFEKALLEMGRRGINLETLIEGDPELAEVFHGYGRMGQLAVREALSRGSRLQAEDIDKRMRAARGSGSASERLQIADATSFADELDELKKLWNEGGLRGFWFGAVSLLGGDFDPEESASALLLRRAFDESANLNDALTGFGLKIARILNGGRPSDKDLQVARRFLPLQSDTDELAEMKFQFLETIFQKRVDAIRDGIEASFGPGSEEDVDEWVRRMLSSPGTAGQGQVIEKQEGTQAGQVEASEGDF